jgi:hypothetical protein
MKKTLYLILAMFAVLGTTEAMAAGGCGTGWHRGPFGGCLRNYEQPEYHACPRGYHIGPGGYCRGNGR